MKRSSLLFPVVAVVLALVAVLLAVPFGSPAARAASSPSFEATFSTASDFYDRFDYGYSGGTPSDEYLEYHGDHDESCGAPTTLREVDLPTDEEADTLDFSKVFWHCAPGGDPAKGHVMTGVVTLGYYIAWFSPRQVFTGTTKVCWDINATQMSSRKWTQVVFVPQSDATSYPDGSRSLNGAQARGVGGYDLGFTSPEFRDVNGPTTGIHPESPDFAVFKETGGMRGHWFDAEGQTTDETGVFAGEDQITADKAARYQHCLENVGADQVRLTEDTPSAGTRSALMPGHIPAGPIRVVFQDDNYNGPKGDHYDPDVNTWHWDNIQIAAESSAETDRVISTPTTGRATASAGGGSDPSPEERAAATAPSSGESDLGPFVLLAGTVAVIAMVVLFVVLRAAEVKRAGAAGAGESPAPPPSQE